MGEDEKKPAIGAGKKRNNNYNRFGGRQNFQSKSTFTSNVLELKEDVFHVGNSSDPAKYSKSLKNIETYIQRTYKIPDDIVKAIQNMTKPAFDPPKKLDKASCTDASGNFDADEFEMAKFTWKEDWKIMKMREQKYQENEANAWALVYNQCSHELRVKLEGTSGYSACKTSSDVVALLTMIKGHCCQFDALNDEYVAIVGAIKNLLYFFSEALAIERGLPRRFHGTNGSD